MARRRSLSELSDVELSRQCPAGRAGGDRCVLSPPQPPDLPLHRSRTGGQDVDDIFQAFFERLLKTGFRALQLWQRGGSCRSTFPA